MIAACIQEEIAPCLIEGGPIAEAGMEFIDAAASLAENAAGSIIRAWCVAHVFAQTEAIFASGTEPVSAFRDLLFRTASLLRTMRDTGFSALGASRLTQANSEEAVEAVTGDHYGQLFRQFAPESYLKETQELLRERLERNGIDVAALGGKSFLDAGCGGGRYTVAARLLGAGPTVGIDVSPVNVKTARERVLEAGLEGVSFEEGDVLNLPCEGESFDIVFSNGVLHHTRDWKRGIAELVRVLRPGGLGWLYVIENPGGLFWDSIEILRIVMQSEDRATARMALQVLGIPGNRIFYMLDHVMVPINVRLTPAEVEQALSDVGASGIRRLERGTDFDRAERIFQQEPFARAKFGVGENRYVFTKA